MSFKRGSSRSHSLNEAPPVAEKLTEEPVTWRTAQSTVTCMYMAYISGCWRRVTLTWCKNLMHHFFTITVHQNGDHHHGHSCKIDLKPWHFWSKKGYKCFDAVEVFWDIRAAKFVGSGPEPCSDFYVALVCEDEVVLLVGDIKKKAYKRTKSRPSLAEPLMLSKRDNVFAKKCFSTRARFDLTSSKDCNIVVETTSTSPDDPAQMWISVDGIVVIHVVNLHWKFRGNQTILLNNHSALHVFWDVHDWMFGGPAGGSARGLFVFKPGTTDHIDYGSGSETAYYSAAPSPSPSPPNDHFSLFLHAWKID